MDDNIIAKSFQMIHLVACAVFFLRVRNFPRAPSPAQVLQGIAQAIPQSTTPAALRTLVPQQTVVGMFRDLRGIASATQTRRTYCLMFDWLYPTHFPVILKCLEAWADVPAVTTPLLKFISEIAYNKSQRLQFDSSSPNGILLFREVSGNAFFGVSASRLSL